MIRFTLFLFVVVKRKTIKNILVPFIKRDEKNQNVLCSGGGWLATGIAIKGF